ncbi:hypothetical protein B0H10DRAFT_2039135 [Mycena sp. CBHHK59/15]|nr:hypothetical protein B0H10DRAFT_2039135 [Mycena sp. CBHHK59/15]
MVALPQCVLSTLPSANCNRLELTNLSSLWVYLGLFTTAPNSLDIQPFLKPTHGPFSTALPPCFDSRSQLPAGRVPPRSSPAPCAALRILSGARGPRLKFAFAPHSQRRAALSPTSALYSAFPSSRRLEPAIPACRERAAPPTNFNSVSRVPANRSTPHARGARRCQAASTRRFDFPQTTPHGRFARRFPLSLLLLRRLPTPAIHSTDRRRAAPLPQL